MAQKFCIGVSFGNLRERHSDLLGAADAKKRKIYLDYSLLDNPTNMKCILAEEIGHVLYPPRPGHIAYHMTGYRYIDNLKRSNIKAIVAQDERRALTWATAVLIPDVEFNRIAEKGNYTVGEIAELFEVETWLVMLKIAYYRRKEREQGRKTKWRDLIRRV